MHQHRLCLVVGGVGNGDGLRVMRLRKPCKKAVANLACGLALLVSDLPDWRQMFVQPGYAQACDSEDPESIARALCRFLEHRAEARQMGERGRQRIAAEWNYETQFRPVLEQLSQTT